MFDYYYGFDATYILVIIGAIITLIASARVKSTYKRYSKIASTSGMTGAQVAAKLLENAGIYDVQIKRVSGELTDHYNPATKVVNLSEVVYDSTSVAAIGVAAHECGHVMQHNENYAPLTFRTALVPVANFGAKASWPLILIGIVASSFLGPNTSMLILQIGIVMFSLSVLFQLVTLPVEFNASARALQKIGDLGILNQSELPYTKKVLKAAAMTYVAAAAAAVLQLIRLLLIARGRGRDDD